MTLVEKNPKVSVCIPVYNGAGFISETVESVLSQAYQDFELIIQDNCSSDGTSAILLDLALRDSRIKIERNETVLSMAENWNCVINRAGGEYVLLLSADDLLAEGFLSECASLLEADSELSVVTTEHMYLKGEKLVRRKIKVAPGKRLLSCKEVLLKNPFSINFSLFRRANLMDHALAKGKVFREPYFTCDYDLWIRLSLAKVHVYFVPYSLATYRVHHGALSRKVIKMIKHTVLVLSANRERLSVQCSAVLRFTLIRMLLRLLYYWARRVGYNRRLVGFVIGRLARG